MEPDSVRSNQVRSGQVRSGQVRSGQVRSGQVRSGQVSIRLAHITDNTLRPPPNPVKSSAVDRATPVFQTPHQRLLKAGPLKSTAAMLFGSGQAQAGRIRVLAAGLRLRRDARGLLFESDACTWSGGPSTRRVQAPPVAISGQGDWCAAPANAQPSRSLPRPEQPPVHSPEPVCM